jgi:hypothetical protein
MLLVHRCDAAEGIQRFSDFAVSYHHASFDPGVSLDPTVHRREPIVVDALFSGCTSRVGALLQHPFLI